MNPSHQSALASAGRDGEEADIVLGIYDSGHSGGFRVLKDRYDCGPFETKSLGPHDLHNLLSLRAKQRNLKIVVVML